MKVLEDKYNVTVLDSLFIEKTCYHCHSRFAIESTDEITARTRTETHGMQWDSYEVTVTYYTVSCPCCKTKNEIRETSLSQKVKDFLSK